MACGLCNAQAPFVFTGFDLNTGFAGSHPANFIVCNGKMFFIASTTTAGQELWVSDGTLSGTSMVKDIYPGDVSSGINQIGNIAVYNNCVYFSANDGVNGGE